MAKKKNPEKKKKTELQANFEGAGTVRELPITETLEVNFMPYAMSVIVSRAIPEIDGFKPSHRKLLYTMYKMGLLNGGRTKSANIVGQTMKLNPHGDGAIYETMVRLSRGNEALLHPYVDSKGNFGKAYSRDMAYAASRYTEAKLAPICGELFKEIDKDAVDFTENYDNSMLEPVLLPSRFPSILVNSNVGMAVGMASSICSFNLQEVCETTIGLLRDEEFDILSTLKGPDFPGGGYIMYDAKQMEQIYKTGRGSVKVRSRYIWDKQAGCVEITEIPPSTTVEAIIDKVADLIKAGKIREISDIRDETDLSGLKITIDLKRGIDADKLMQKLMRMTPLEDHFACNFNVLIAGTPQVLGVRELLLEWIAFRQECVKRRIFFEVSRKKEKLHLLKGLAKILLDIDKAISIVRETEEEDEVVPNLMIGFGIDKIQAEYVAEIKLRHLNREYILNRTQETETLENEIAAMEEVLKSTAKVRGVIVDELKEVIKKYAQPRKSLLKYISEEDLAAPEKEEIPDYPVNLFFTKEGYFKKITPQSLRMSSAQKLKENDEIVQHMELSNSYELLFFSDKAQVYKSFANEFEDTKASVLGDFIPAKLGMENGENAIYMVATKDYSGNLLFVFENGKVAKVPLAAYETKTKRKKLTKAYSDKSPIVKIIFLPEEKEYLFTSSVGKALLVHTGLISLKATRDTQGIAVMTLKKGVHVIDCVPYTDGMLESPHIHRSKNLPAAGKVPKFSGEQLML